LEFDCSLLKKSCRDARNVDSKFVHFPVGRCVGLRSKDCVYTGFSEVFISSPRLSCWMWVLVRCLHGVSVCRDWVRIRSAAGT
jgi:hypothetical protein